MSTFYLLFELEGVPFGFEVVARTTTDAVHLAAAFEAGHKMAKPDGPRPELISVSRRKSRGVEYLPMIL